MSRRQLNTKCLVVDNSTVPEKGNCFSCRQIFVHVSNTRKRRVWDELCPTERKIFSCRKLSSISFHWFSCRQLSKHGTHLSMRIVF